MLFLQSLSRRIIVSSYMIAKVRSGPGTLYSFFFREFKLQLSSLIFSLMWFIIIDTHPLTAKLGKLNKSNHIFTLITLITEAVVCWSKPKNLQRLAHLSKINIIFSPKCLTIQWTENWDIFARRYKQNWYCFNARGRCSDCVDLCVLIGWSEHFFFFSILRAQLLLPSAICVGDLSSQIKKYLNCWRFFSSSYTMFSRLLLLKSIVSCTMGGRLKALRLVTLDFFRNFHFSLLFSSIFHWIIFTLTSISIIIFESFLLLLTSSSFHLGITFNYVILSY